MNVIEITAKNDCGEVSETINVEYAPCITPKISMISPSTNSTQTEQEAFVLKAKTRGDTITSLRSLIPS